jgi:hypothetical protein
MIRIPPAKETPAMVVTPSTVATVAVEWENRSGIGIATVTVADAGAAVVPAVLTGEPTVAVTAT